MQILRKNVSVQTLRGFLPAGIIALMIAAASSVLAQPANDYFTNAAVMPSTSGYLAGSNVGATTEPGEPNILGIPGGASVWYFWTAPTDGTVSISTFGSDFDTLLGVYTGNSVDNLTFVAGNDDASGAVLQSLVTFPVTAGVKYMVVVDGFGGAQGNISLAWNFGGPSLFAGDFGFTTGVYFFSENELNPPVNGFMLATGGARVTVNRAIGASGRVNVDFTVGPGSYTNYVTTEVWGTNTYTTNYSDTNFTTVAGFTNVFVTNTIVTNLFEDFEYGFYTYLPPFILFTNVSITNANGSISQSKTNTLLGTNTPDIFCSMQGFTNRTVDTTALTSTIIITNYFCTNWIITNIVDAATNGVDYIAGSGTLTFDDYQMSSDIFVPVFPHPAPRDPFTMVANRVIVVSIDQVALDPLESSDIPPPTAASPLATTLIDLFDMKTYRPRSRGIAQELLGDPRAGLPDTGVVGTNVINFERATLECTENVNGQFVAHVAAVRNTRDASGSITANYRLDFLEQRQQENANDLFQGLADEMQLQAGSDYATPTNASFYSASPDFDGVAGTLSWGAFDVQPKLFDIPITNDNIVEFNEDILMQLPYDQGTRIGYVGEATLTILFDNIAYGEQPAGAVDRMHNMDDDASSTPPYNLHPGANGTVYAVAVQPDGSTLMGGAFSAFNTVPRNNLARMQTNGQIDLTFNPGDGADQFVTTLALDSQGKILVGGAFTAINRISRHGIARLNPNGSLDNSFNPGLGADGVVWALANQTNGSILIAGEFQSYNSTNRQFIARVLPDGLIDPSFDPGIGPDGPIYCMALQPNGKVIIGGQFLNVDGTPSSGIARLNSDGTLDTTFSAGSGANGIVYTLALQQDNKILVGGAFSSLHDVARNGISRLNSDGSVDLGFNPGSGSDDTVYSIVLQPDGFILVGGIFTSFNDTRRVGITRLFPWGIVDTSFMDVAYNQFAGLINHYHNTDVEANNFIFDIALQPDGNVIIGGGFTRVGGGVTRDDIRNRSNIARLIGGSTPGPGNIELAYQNYSADQNGGPYFVSMMRTNGSLGPAGVTIAPRSLPPGPGAAVQGVDFFLDPIYGNPFYTVSYPDPTWMLSDGLFGQNQGFSQSINTNTQVQDPNNDVFIQVFDSTNAGNKFLSLELSRPRDMDLFLLGGQKIPLGVALGRSSSPMTIVDYHVLPGTLGFSSPTYIVSEATNAVINITRTNGSTGLVTVQCETLDGTATNNIHYRTNYQRLSFNPGVTNLTFTVTNINESIIEHDHTINLRLFSPSGGATLGQSNAVITVVDDDCQGGYAQFSSGSYFTNENAGYALVTVTRNGGSLGTLVVQFATTNGTASSGVNYVGTTNALTWGNGEITPKIIAIQLFDDHVVNPANLTVGLKLFASTINGVTNNLCGLGNPTNAVLVITNSDLRGVVSFSTTNYFINENGGPATVTVVRSGGSTEAINVNFATLPGTAAPSDFTATNGVLSFGPGVVSRSFTVPICDNQIVDGNRFITLSLSNASPTGTLGSPSTAILTIVDDESFHEPAGGEDTGEDPTLGFNAAVTAMSLQPDGKILVGGDFTTANGLVRTRIARLLPDCSLDSKFSSINPALGVDDTVLTIINQTDGRIVIGGRFSSVNSVNRNFVARLTFDGSLDTTFNPGSGADGSVYSLAETFVGTNRKLLIGGAFTSLAAVPRNYLGRLNDDGTVDSSFNVGIGANAAVFAIAMQPDGKAIIGGDFTLYNAVARGHIARINADGALDLSFNPGAGAGNSVRSIALQSDGRILIGGFFTNVNGVALSHIARLNADGSVDSTFTPGVGADDVVSAITLQPDTRIVLGGQFTMCNGVTRHRLTRLNNDGTVDPTINFGAGLDSFVSAVLVQPDRKIVVGGGFSNYDSVPHAHVVRVYGGSIAGPGAFEFTSANYQFDETATNAVVTVRRRGGTSGAPSGNVSVSFTTTNNGTAIPGSNYMTVTTNLSFPPGEVFRDVVIPVFHDFAITPDLTVGLALSNPQPTNSVVTSCGPGWPVLGNQPISTLTILNDDASVSFSAANYTRNEDASDGFATMQIVRAGSVRGTASVGFVTLTNGTAVAYTNYIPVTNTVFFNVGDYSNSVQVPVIHDPSAQGDRTVIMQLTNALGAFLFTPSVATLTILDVEHLSGRLQFGQTNYVVGEGDGFLPVTIIRTNGTTGIISVNFTTIPGTALPGIKYVTTNGILTFSDGESNKTFTVPIIQNNTVEGNQTFSLLISNVTGGAVLSGPTTVPATIIDDDTGVTFASPAYVVPETGGSVSLTVLRQNGTNQVTTVHYATTNVLVVTTNPITGVISTNISAQAGVNYVPASGTLLFTNGETIKSFSINVLHDPRVTGDLSFGVNLLNPSAPAQLLNPSSAIVTVLDSEPGFAFTNANFTTIKSGTNVVITVLRTNANTGLATVNFGTADGTAIAGVDYVTRNGLLTFSNGIALQSFTVPIINNRLVEGDRTFTVYLTNATPTNLAQLIPPFTAAVTITDDVSGLSFSSPVYSINENGISQTVTVLRTGYTNSVVSVDYSTANGSGVAGVNYIATSGTFNFTNGDTVKTFSVPVIDNGIADGDKTVLLSLANVTGNAVLVNPSAATLTINDIDGSLILPAGSALISESGPVNGLIDTNETVTLLLALRNASGTNTVNLTATLLATNGITNPSGPQNYGALTVHGGSASRPFTFTAQGTNGQTITATLQLRDGSTVLSNASFNFTLGTGIVTYSNVAPIVINDFAAGSPYPSVINVSGLSGLTTKATVMLTNVYHTWPSDIDILLVSPSGQKSLLMSKAGGGNTLNKVTLTFDDSAATSLPQGTQIVSGTNKPTSYAVAPPPFPLPAPPAPYNTNLSSLSGSNPNGTWSLYVYDDSQFNSGIISNGWVLRLSTASPTSADMGIAMVASQTNNIVATSNFSYTITVANYGPSSANGITVSDPLPAGAAFVSSSPSLGTASVTSGVLNWSIPSMGTNTSATLTLVISPGLPGPITNTATVATLTTDGNPDNNSATIIGSVSAPAADLVLGLIGVPNPVLVGNTVTYTLLVNNLGPSTATGVSLTNTLDPTIAFVSASPGGYSLSTVNGHTVVTYPNLGNVGSGAAASVTIVGRPTAAVTTTNFASCGSTITDPLKANNSASVKIVVQGVTMTAVKQGGNLVISWPAGMGDYGVESTTNSVPPMVWSPVTSPPPQTNGNTVTITLPIGAVGQFFRLHGR
jgi:uncharacterized delta-60 repeat protein/uncharacterized repeat protein (TIGR01451 family)